MAPTTVALIAEVIAHGGRFESTPQALLLITPDDVHLPPALVAEVGAVSSEIWHDLHKHVHPTTQMEDA